MQLLKSYLLSKLWRRKCEFLYSKERRKMDILNKKYIFPVCFRYNFRNSRWAVSMFVRTVMVFKLDDLETRRSWNWTALRKWMVVTVRLWRLWTNSLMILKKAIDSQKIEFWNFEFIIRILIKNESGDHKMRSYDSQNFRFPIHLEWQISLFIQNLCFENSAIGLNTLFLKDRLVSWPSSFETVQFGTLWSSITWSYV